MEERSRLQPPWLQRKSTGTASTLQSYQGDSTLAASGTGAAAAPSDVGSVHTSTSLLGRYHHFPKSQILMNEAADRGSLSAATAPTASCATSGASIISSVNHYDSSLLHATLGPLAASVPPPPPPRSQQKNNQAPKSAWRKLLSNVFQSGTNTTRAPPPTAAGGCRALRPRPLTLGHHHRLNTENTLRLEAHRQLFQFNDYHMHHQDNDQQMMPTAAAASASAGPHQQPPPSCPARGHFCSNDSSLQYYASVGFYVTFTTAIYFHICHSTVRSSVLVTST